MLLNYGYHRFYDWFLYPFRLDIAQDRLAQYSTSHLRAVADGRLLDVACGRGKTTYMLSAQYPHATAEGIDLVPEHVDIANSVYGSSENLTYSVGNAEQLPFNDASFDGIHCLEAAFHFDRERFLSECRRVLRSKGILVLVDFMWRDDADRKVIETAEGRIVRDTWQMRDLSSEDEYLRMAKDNGLSVTSRTDLSRRVTTAALKRFRMMSSFGASPLGRQVLCHLNPNLRQFSREDWKEILESTHAHATVARQMRYVCLVLERA